jgi:bifunctional non-homologous end joining protein LigD
MLPSSASEPPDGDGWVHEAKLDGFRCLAQVKSSRLRLWSRVGGEWVDRLPELDGLASLGDVVLDGEVVVLTADGRADFELLGARIHGRRHNPDGHLVTFFVFDVLQFAGRNLIDEPWLARRRILDDLDLGARSGGAAGPTFWTADGEAMHQATRRSGRRALCRSVRIRSIGRADPGTGEKRNTRSSRRSRWPGGAHPQRDGRAGCSRPTGASGSASAP